MDVKEDIFTCQYGALYKGQFNGKSTSKKNKVLKQL